MIKEIFGYNLKKYRNSKELTQEHLAELLDVSTTQIYKMESGKSFASAEMIEKIASLFDIPPYKFFMTESDLDTCSDDFQECARYIKSRIDLLFAKDIMK
ncbi:MAG: helix-turn-helix domain-containing protein [Geovibrio sp.]|uniref:helix-turn-helix domain-containing protein n=1 Tax=Geovibrio ferrireducens TaxID=46201 RepID=UPI002245174E|nr:helix-turn-helix transcriptional regulator [Geovibrio ferrireducens]MCD8569105.1 helix-turn-helix domain-containing protein [Geovibrio sp.]